MSNIYETITNQIVAAIEQSGGPGKYKLPWQGSSELPKNVASYKPYRGMNVLILWAEAQKKGYGLPLWGTYKQWQELGGQVRRGEKSTTVTFWNFQQVTSKSEGENLEASESTSKRVWMKPYFVFNVAQSDGIDLSRFIKPEPGVTNQRIPAAEEFFANLKSKVTYGGPRAYYDPARDRIQMPPFTAFEDERYFYSVLGHEHTHWTAAQGRMERDLTGRFRSESYAMEELIAELGAAFLCAHLGINAQPRADHAQYIHNWLQVLKGDSRAIFTAASHAQKAVDWMAERQPEAKVSQPQAEPEAKAKAAKKGRKIVEDKGVRKGAGKKRVAA
jgi:antirestriction protein ArdC